MTSLLPADRGCWYCHQDDEHEPLRFCCEFDTYLHITCLKNRMREIASLDLSGVSPLDYESHYLPAEMETSLIAAEMGVSWPPEEVPSDDRARDAGTGEWGCRILF